MACPECGNENVAEARFCARCGSPLAVEASTPTVVGEVSPKSKKVCSGCRTLNEAAAVYCYRCGLKLSDRLYGETEITGSPAGFWIRLAAYLVDEVLLVIAVFLLAITFTGMDPEQVIDEMTGESTGGATTLLNLVLGVVYYTFAIGQWGQTIGKAIFGLKVTRADGSRLTFWRSFARYWAYFVSFIPIGLGFIAIALSSQKRGWHDLICDTRVLNLRG